MALEININKYQEMPVLELTGRVVDVDAKRFSKRLEFLFKKDYAAIIIDLSKTNFIDSHGLGIIVYYHTMMQRAKRKLIVVNANPNPQNYIARLFDLTNLYSVFSVAASLDQIKD